MKTDYSKNVTQLQIQRQTFKEKYSLSEPLDQKIAEYMKGYFTPDWNKVDSSKKGEVWSFYGEYRTAFDGCMAEAKKNLQMIDPALIQEKRYDEAQWLIVKKVIDCYYAIKCWYFSSEISLYQSVIGGEDLFKDLDSELVQYFKRVCIEFMERLDVEEESSDCERLEEESFEIMEEEIAPQNSSQIFDGDAGMSILSNIFEKCNLNFFVPSFPLQDFAKIEKLSEDSYRLYFKSDQPELEISKVNGHLVFSGEKVSEILKNMFNMALEQKNCGTLFPFDEVQSIELLGGDLFNLSFKGPLEGQASKVDKGGWKDMLHNRIVSKDTVAIGVYYGSIAFEENAVNIGVHLEDYDFAYGLAPQALHSVISGALRLGGYVHPVWGTPQYGIEVSAGISLIEKTDDGLQLHFKIHDDKKNKVFLSKNIGKLPGSEMPYSHLETLGATTLEVPLTDKVFQASFSHIDWQVSKT